MDMKTVHENIVSHLTSFAVRTGFTDCVLGLSGGLDSSVVAPLCVEAFGAEHVHGVLLPGPYSSDHSVEDALELAGRLGIDTQTISIVEPYDAFARVLGAACGGKLEGIPAENTQSRCRMICLMALSNKHGWMLVNTGNLSEAFMGYSTLYGDTAGAFAPLGHLYKTEVRLLGRFINETCRTHGGIEPIPERVFVKPPSAELSANQSDEKSFGVDYETLDKVLSAHFDEGFSVDQIVQMGFKHEVVEHIVTTAESYAFKRAQLPPTPSHPQAKG